MPVGIAIASNLHADYLVFLSTPVSYFLAITAVYRYALMYISKVY